MEPSLCSICSPILNSGLVHSHHIRSELRSFCRVGAGPAGSSTSPPIGAHHPRYVWRVLQLRIVQEATRLLSPLPPGIWPLSSALTRSCSLTPFPDGCVGVSRTLHCPLSPPTTSVLLECYLEPPGKDSNVSSNRMFLIFWPMLLECYLCRRVD